MGISLFALIRYLNTVQQCHCKWFYNLFILDIVSLTTSLSLLFKYLISLWYNFIYATRYYMRYIEDRRCSLFGIFLELLYVLLRILDSM